MPASSEKRQPSFILSASLEKTLRRSLALATARKHQKATLEHLLLALIEDEESATMLDACAIDIAQLRAKLDAFLDEQSTLESTDDSVDARPTASFQRVIQRAGIHVQSSGRTEVTGSNVVVAMFSERDAPAVSFLSEQGMSRLDAVNFISHDIAKRPGWTRSSFQRAQAEPSNRHFVDDASVHTDAPADEAKLTLPIIALRISDFIDDVTRYPAATNAPESLMTMGLYGPWGSGKSTLIHALRKELRRRGYLSIDLNPWKWSGKDDLYGFVLKEVQAQLARTKFYLDLTLLRAMLYVREHASRLFWLIVLILLLYWSLVRFDWTHLSSSAATLVRDSVLFLAVASLIKVVAAPFAKHLENALVVTDKRLPGHESLSTAYRYLVWLHRRRRTRGRRPMVFFVDDLDRCSASRVAEFLESLHSLTTAGCVTFLACDDSYVEAALYSQYEDIARHHRDGKKFGTMFLKKIVQVPFRLPALSDNDLLDLGFRGSAKDNAPAPDTPDPGVTQAGAPNSLGRDENESGAQNGKADKIDNVVLTSIVGRLFEGVVSPLQLNIRDLKSISNTVKLYLMIEEPRDERSAERVAAFVFANMLDPEWLDATIQDRSPHSGNIAGLRELSDRLHRMIGRDPEKIAHLYRLVGRAPPSVEESEAGFSKVPGLRPPWSISTHGHDLDMGSRER